MPKFLRICHVLKRGNRLDYRRVNEWFRYLQWETNRDKYFPISLIRYTPQETPAAMITFNP